MDLVYILDRLDRTLHPRQRKGIRWVLWNLVNFASSFLSFWRYCYGCGTFKGCTCPVGDPAAFVIGARTAASVAWGIWRPTWDARYPIARPAVPRIGVATSTRDLLDRLVALNRAATSGPWKVEVGQKFSFDNWLLADFGIDGDEDHHVYLSTNGVRASDCGGEGAAADAQVCAKLRNLLPQIIAALRSRVAFRDVPTEVTRG